MVRRPSRAPYHCSGLRASGHSSNEAATGDIRPVAEVLCSIGISLDVSSATTETPCFASFLSRSIANHTHDGWLRTEPAVLAGPLRRLHTNRSTPYQLVDARAIFSYLGSLASGGPSCRTTAARVLSSTRTREDALGLPVVWLAVFRRILQTVGSAGLDYGPSVEAIESSHPTCGDLQGLMARLRTRYSRDLHLTRLHRRRGDHRSAVESARPWSTA